MPTIAILAPIVADATPEQKARAHRAMMEQMMLLARGYAVDSPAVRCAAEMVGSAVAADPVDYVLPPLADDRASAGEPGNHGDDREDGTAPRWQRSEGYARYLRTIMSGQPDVLGNR